jgi:hypothetical protein
MNITPDPLTVELDFYKERNMVIHKRNELLENENRIAHNRIRELQIQLARANHPAAIPHLPGLPKPKDELLKGPTFEELIAQAEEKGEEPPNDD